MIAATRRQFGRWSENSKAALAAGAIPLAASSYEFHSGQDIDARTGDPVVAGASGKVTFVGWQNGYGQLVVIDHGGGLTTRYGHLSHIDVAQDQTVERSEFIGRVGSTGRSTGPHLHYEIRINDEPVNPLQYLLTSAARVRLFLLTAQIAFA